MGDPPAPRRTLGPLLGAVLLAVAAGGAAAAVTLHGRPTARLPQPSPSATPAVSTPGPTPVGAAPVGDPTSAAWDSTHHVLLTYSPNDTSFPGAVATWDGTRWRRQATAAGAPGVGGVLVDMPALSGVLLVSGRAGPPFTGASTNVWLWNGSAWTQLPPARFAQCLAPASGAWDEVRAEVVVVLSNDCAFGINGPIPPETWTFDGHTWVRRGVAPDGVLFPVLAWDVDARKVAMLQGPGDGDPNPTDREWWWSGTDWEAGGTLPGALAPMQFTGAAWDSSAHGLVVIPDNAAPGIAYVVRSGAWSVLHAQVFPQRVLAVAGDTAGGRVLVIGQQLIVPGSRPDPAAGAYYVLGFDGRTWLRLP